MILIIIGPSASGKDTELEKRVKLDEMEPIITFTTRPMRENEKNGKDYHFISKNKFLELKEDGFFFETREYNTCFNDVDDIWYYGSPVVEDYDTKQYVVITDLNGVYSYIEKYGVENIEVLYLDIAERIRKSRAYARPSFDFKEWDRRAEDDRKVFSEENIKQLKACYKNLKFTTYKGEIIEWEDINGKKMCNAAYSIQ